VSVAGVLLAAGGGRRFGMPKALVEHRGRLLVEHAASVLRDGGCVPVVVVLGAQSDEVRSRASLGDAVLVDNPDWATGMGSSLRAGLAALADSDVTAAVVVPVDTPGLTAAAVRRVVALVTPQTLVRAVYDGEPGHPVALGRAHWAGAAAGATGDQGAREYLRDHEVIKVDCADVAIGADADRPEDLPT
jgi:nicotine blue oxidoreductase